MSAVSPAARTTVPPSPPPRSRSPRSLGSRRPLHILVQPDWSLRLERIRERLALEWGEPRSPGQEANEAVSESSGRVPLPHRPRPTRASFLPATLPCAPWTSRTLRAPSPGLPPSVLHSSPALSLGAGVSKPWSLDPADGCDRAPVHRLAGLCLLGSS